MQWVDLQCVILVFLGHTRLLFVHAIGLSLISLYWVIKRILGECLLISILPGKALRTLADIARLAERFSIVFSKRSLVNLVSKDADLVFYKLIYCSN